MTSGARSEIEGETTRSDKVVYLQGARGHALGSSSLLLVAGGLAILEYRLYGWILAGMAAVVSLNGLSIWAWDGLRAYFEPSPESRSEPTRTLHVSPLDSESLVEMKAGAVLLFGIVTLLLAGRAVLEAFSITELRLIGVVAVLCLGIGNGLALLVAYARSR
jgi:hypothetical protein